jgi:hypothetical protein
MTDKSTQIPQLSTAGLDDRFLRERNTEIENLTAHYIEVIGQQTGMADAPPAQVRWLARYAAVRERSARERGTRTERMHSGQSNHSSNSLDDVDVSGLRTGS